MSEPVYCHEHQPKDPKQLVIVWPEEAKHKPASGLEQMPRCAVCGITVISGGSGNVTFRP